MRKPLFRNQYYVELSSQDAAIPRPGVFFYGPVLFDVHVVATIRPVMDPSGRGYVQHRGHMVFDVCAPLPPDAFQHPRGFPPVIAPYEELVAVPGKMRPVVVLSPEEANAETMLIVPGFKAANYDAASLDTIRAGLSLQHFYLPECPALNVVESVLELQKVQAVYRDPKFVNPGNRKASDPRRQFLRLSDSFFASLREALHAFLAL